MRNLLLIFSVLFLFACSNNAQTNLAQWTFPTGTSTDATPDDGITENLTKIIEGIGGVSSPIDFSKNGFTTKSAQCTGWDNGMDTKYWQIEVSTSGYQNITISSRQQSGGNNPGPKDFKLQYKIGTEGTWTDIPSGTITLANDWETSNVNNLALPVECNNQASVFVRWIMTSNDDSAGGTVAATGISKIDEIYVKGDVLNSVKESSLTYNLYPNPSNGILNISSDIVFSGIKIFDISGKVVVNQNEEFTNKTFDLSGLNSGLYLIKLFTEEKILTEKFFMNN